MTPSRTLLRRTLLGACLLGAAAMPPWLEAKGQAAVRTAFACGDRAPSCGELSSIDLHAQGLSLQGVWRRVGTVRVEARELQVSLREGGIVVRAFGVGVVPAEPEPPAASAAEPASAARRGAAPPRARRTVPSTHGLSVDVQVDEPVHVVGPRGTSLTLARAHARLDGHGGLALDVDARIEHAALPGRPHVRARAQAQGGDLERWIAEADVKLQEGEPPLSVQATLDGSIRGIRVSARDSGGGTLTAQPAGTRGVLLHAQDFPIDTLVRLAGRRALPGGIDPTDATFSGTVEAHLSEAKSESGAEHPRLHLADVQLHGLRIDDPRVAREPLVLDALTVSGDVARRPGGGFADLVLARGEAEIAVSVSADPERLVLSLELPEHECQTLLDALPGAMKDTLEGMRMAGRLEGHVRLSIDRTALASARESYGGEPGEVPPQPGELDLSMPVLEACTVIADPATIDLAALAGPYRHRFAAASGQARTRTLAPGAPGFAPLSTVRLLADAFVTLEDRRFFQHDGFDREQMHNALWHNVLRGGVHRGASTISQQATRNLWLGVDRSLARKLQEALLTSRLETEVPKERILELYLNVIELGPDVHGVEAAAQYWFGKPAAELDVREAVHVAALAPAPRRFARRFAGGEVDEAWEAMIDRQIRRMWLAGRISAAERDRGLRRRLRIQPH